MSTNVAWSMNHKTYQSGEYGNGFARPVESVPYLTQQYALPIHQAASRRYSSDASLDSGEETPRPENSLRRKTPNGTLNAGYDGTSDHWNPQKHQLLSLSEPNSIRYMQAPPTNGKRTFLQHQQRNNSDYGRWNASWGLEWPDTQLPQPQGSIVGMDSMLHQMPSQAYNAQPYYSQTVPSVRQPSFQHVGPTALGVQGSGPYGPYWHDGTYVPYRPAAVRDPRFYHHFTANWPGTLPPSQLTPQSNAWQQTAFAQAQLAQVQSFHPFSTQGSGHAYPSTHKFSLYNDSTPALNRQRPIEFGQASTHHPLSRQDPSAIPRDLPSNASQDVKSEYGPSSPNGKHRDKTFAWALQQYRELLTFIHHARRQQQQARLIYGQQQIPQRPSFYPRPPKPSYSGSSLQLSRRRSGPAVQQHSAGRDGVALSESDSKGDARNSDSEFEVSKARPASLWSSSGAQHHDTEQPHRASHEQHRGTEKPWNHRVEFPADKFRTLRRSSGSSVSAMVSPVPADDSPPARATFALSWMTKLCQETDWRWTDGMHLGGCLAYGLGHYQKALRWYKKVLEMDPKHLEATSNLAATLLALGQRHEAEQHWTKVVKAAPNHFEAVEHLVGMLCNDQRSKDAVRIIEYVERTLRQPNPANSMRTVDRHSECSSSNASRSPCVSERSDKFSYDFEIDGDDAQHDWREAPGSTELGFGSSGFAIPGCDNGRILALIHAKGNMLYGLGDNAAAARAFEDAVLIAAGRKFAGIQELVKHILSVVSSSVQQQLPHQAMRASFSSEPILLTPEQALTAAKLCFPFSGELPGLQYLPGGQQSIARKAVISTTSNSLLSLAKIFQDSMANTNRASGITPLASGVRDILALYYLSLSLQPSPSTANNVGILLASVQQGTIPSQSQMKIDIPGVLPGSGIALALRYYNYGLQLDKYHAHLYTNLGSLLKDIGQLDAAIGMYERAVQCDSKFDIALANLANAVKDKGRISDAITYYKRAVEVSPEFAEAVCGLANALNSVCAWHGRGGIAEDNGKRDRWHVDPDGMFRDSRMAESKSSGWIKRVVEIVDKQLADGERWGCGVMNSTILEDLVHQLTSLDGSADSAKDRKDSLRKTLTEWKGQKWEGARVTRLIERAIKRIGWQWYRDSFVQKQQRQLSSYNRPQLPVAITVPTAPTVLPFHTFTCPMSAKQIRQISQRNGSRISVSTLRSPWLPKQVFPPPTPPAPYLRVGYISSDFNNHPLAHLMQSIFGIHDETRVKAHCYATTASDNSVHRQQIQSEAPVFHDASNWNSERLAKQVVKDGIHILVNLNGYTRGARNEVFAARPAPVQMSFMGFAGTLGAEWCDYLLADETAVPPNSLRPWRRNIDLEDQIQDENNSSENEEWVYGENIIFCRDTFFCCDHKQSAPDTEDKRLTWDEEQQRRWQMRKELFPQISDETIIFGNFNQLYKIDPTTFRTWLRILSRVKNSILWLLRFPDLGESHLIGTARRWAGPEVASRVIFTDVAPKHLHISRARICDLVLDTAECNAHTTAADVLWSGTPLLTLPRYQYKMCSRMAASILKSALPKTEEGMQASKELIATSEEDYEEKAIALGRALSYTPGSDGKARGRLMELRKVLFHSRWSSALFDTKRWVRDLEDAYEEAWRRWVAGEGGDIYLDSLTQGADVHQH